MESLIIHFKTSKQKNIVKKILKALDTEFETTSTHRKEKRYNPEFVAKIKKSAEDYKKGRARTVDIDSIWK